MNDKFVQLRFTGARFENHALPVDVARDLVAYEGLLIELAKSLYICEHPERQRVYKGFSDVQLAIVSVDEGSAMPVLALMPTSALPLPMLFEKENPYFPQARDLIAECVAAQDTALPANFPKELLSHFNQFGRSLRAGEALELDRAHNMQAAILNPEKRKKLVLAANTVYERDVELSGSIGEADWEKSTFRLRLDDGSFAVIPMPENFHDKIRQSGGRNMDCVFVKGVAAYDSWERLQKVLSIESLEVIRNYRLATQFDELARLEAGWYEGRGKALNIDNLKIIAQRMIDSYPERLPLPTIVPTQEGDLLLEWDAVGDPSVDIDLDGMDASFHAFGSNGEDLEENFPLRTNDDFKSLLSFLSEHIRLESA
jgi:hypothetical protein